MALSEAKQDAINAVLAWYQDSNGTNEDCISAIEGIFAPDNVMGLRDWFAMTALQGILSNGMTSTDKATDLVQNTRMAYAYADNMLEARKK